jgi:hypothetical protein
MMFKGLFAVRISYPLRVGFTGLLRAGRVDVQAPSAAVFTAAIPALFIIGHDACHPGAHAAQLAEQNRRPAGDAPGLPRLCRLGLRPQQPAPRLDQREDQGPGLDAARKKEYDALSPGIRLVHRMYRTWWGVGPYYMIEMWIKFGMDAGEGEIAQDQSPVLVRPIVGCRLRDRADRRGF